MLTARVYEMVKSDVQYTRDKVVQYIKAKQQARATIDKMRKENIIDMIGKGKASKYVLVKS